MPSQREGSVYPSDAASPFIGVLSVPSGKAIASLVVHATGTEELRATVFPHLIGKGMGEPLTNVVGTPLDGSLVVPLDRAGLLPTAGVRLQLWVFGVTETTPLSGASYTLVDAVKAPTPPATSASTTTTTAATTVAVAAKVAQPTPAPARPPATTTTTTAPTTTTTTVPNGGYGYRPMSPTSPWNTPIPANAVWYGDPNDTSQHTLWQVPGSGPRHWYLNTDFDYSCGVWFPKATDAVWTFTLPTEWRGHPPTSFQMRAPTNFTVGTRVNGDNPASLVFNGELWDLYGVKITSQRKRTATIFAYGHQSLANGTGFGTPGQMWENGLWNIDPATGTRAANTPWGVVSSLRTT
jgi:hypothetical protein